MTNSKYTELMLHNYFTVGKEIQVKIYLIKKKFTFRNASKLYLLHGLFFNSGFQLRLYDRSFAGPMITKTQ